MTLLWNVPPRSPDGVPTKRRSETCRRTVYLIHFPANSHYSLRLPVCPWGSADPKLSHPTSQKIPLVFVARRRREGVQRYAWKSIPRPEQSQRDICLAGIPSRA